VRQFLGVDRREAAVPERAGQRIGAHGAVQGLRLQRADAASQPAVAAQPADLVPADKQGAAAGCRGAGAQQCEKGGGRWRQQLAGPVATTLGLADRGSRYRPRLDSAVTGAVQAGGSPGGIAKCGRVRRPALGTLQVMDERVECVNSVLHASCVRNVGLLLPRLHGGAGRLGRHCPHPKAVKSVEQQQGARLHQHIASVGF
jgi:hypothetical protein